MTLEEYLWYGQRLPHLLLNILIILVRTCLLKRGQPMEPLAQAVAWQMKRGGER
jgi:hypothetical protein